MKRLSSRFLILITIYLAGCAAFKNPEYSLLRNNTIDDWPRIYEENFFSIRTLKSEALLTIEKEDLATSVTVEMIYAAPDTLFMLAEGPFGLDLGKIFIGHNRFIIYNQFNNQFFSGSLNDEYYNKFLETDLTFRQIKFALLGYVPLPQNLRLVDEKHGVFSALVSGSKWRFVVNVNTGNLRSWEIFKNGKPVLKQEFRRYRIYNGVLLPGLIRIIRANKLEMISIFHRNKKINEMLDPNKYKIEIGPKVKQLIIGG